MANELPYHDNRSAQYSRNYNVGQIMISDDNLHPNYSSNSRQQPQNNMNAQHGYSHSPIDYKNNPENLGQKMQSLHLENQRNAQSSRTWNNNQENSHNSRQFTSNQRNSKYTQEVGQPQILAKKTNDANPVAVFGVVAKVDHLSPPPTQEPHFKSFPDSRRMHEATAEQHSSQNYPSSFNRPYEAEYRNQYDAPPANKSRVPLMPPQAGNQSRDFHRENQPQFQGGVQPGIRNTQPPIRHWTIRKPSQSDEQRSDSQRHQPFEHSSNAASLNNNNSRQIPPRPEFSNSQAPPRLQNQYSENYSSQNQPTSRPMRSQQHHVNPSSSNLPTQYQSSSYPPRNEGDRSYQAGEQSRDMYDRNNQSYHDTPPSYSNSQSAIHPNNNNRNGNWSNRPAPPPKPGPTSQDPNNYQSTRPDLGYGQDYPRERTDQDQYYREQAMTNQDQSQFNPMQYDRRPDDPTRNYSSYNAPMQHQSRNQVDQRQYDENRSDTNIRRDQDFTPSIVAKSYQSFNQQAMPDRGNTVLPNTTQAKKENFSEHSRLNPPEDYQNPPPVPRRPKLPLHPFDPVEDSSGSDRTVEQSPPPTSRPSGWSHRKLGGFSYLPNLHQNAPSSDGRASGSHTQSSLGERSQTTSAHYSDETNKDNSSEVRTRHPPYPERSRKVSSRAKGSEKSETSDESRVDDLTPEDSISCRPSPEPQRRLAKPAMLPKPRKKKPQPQEKTIKEANHTKRNPVSSRSDLENKFVFKLPSDDALKRASAHPIPGTQRVPQYEGFGNVSKQKTSLGSELIGQLKSAKDSALRPLAKMHERSKSVEALDRSRPRPPVKLSEEEIRLRKNAAAVLKTIEVVDKNREEHQRTRSFEGKRNRGRSRSRDRLSSPGRRGRSRSRDRLSSPGRRGRSRSRDRLSSPGRRGRSRSRDRLSSPGRRGRSRSRDRLSSPGRRGRSRSRDRLSSPGRRGRSRSRDRLSSPGRRGRSISRDRLSSPGRRGRSKSRDRLSSPGRRGRSRSRDRLSSPNRRGRSRSRDRLSSPVRRGRSRSRDRLSSPNRRGRSRSRDRLSSPNKRGRSRSRDRLSSPGRRGRTRPRDRLSSPHRPTRAKSRDRQLSPDRRWERDDRYRQSERSRNYSPPHAHYDRRPPPYYSDESDWSDYSRRTRPPSDVIAARRAWVNDPRWRLNKHTQPRAHEQPLRHDSRGNPHAGRRHDYDDRNPYHRR